MSRLASDGKGLRIGEQLWDAIEAPQGRSFVSSDAPHWTDAEALEFVQNALDDARTVVRIMERINKKYRFGDPLTAADWEAGDEHGHRVGG